MESFNARNDYTRRIQIFGASRGNSILVWIVAIDEKFPVTRSKPCTLFFIRKESSESPSELGSNQEKHTFLPGKRSCAFALDRVRTRTSWSPELDVGEIKLGQKMQINFEY